MKKEMDRTRAITYGVIALATLGFAAPFLFWHWQGKKFTVGPIVGLAVAGILCMTVVGSVLPGEEPVEKAKTTKASASDESSAEDEAATEVAEAKKAEAEKRAAALKAKAERARKLKAQRAAAARRKAAAARRERQRQAAAAAAAAAAQNDPQFGTCGEANDNGYGPYSRGEPEYAWYDDRDSDGMVCE